MASDPQSILSGLQQNDFVAIAIMTAVGYDYMLTFSRELEYIWNKPWTLVSTLFVLVRYLGLYSYITYALLGSAFLPGPAKVCDVFAVINLWAIFTFICAADLVMILRVWSMYNRSKLILGVLIISYVAEVVPSTISCIVYTIPQNVSVGAIQILDISFCMVAPISPKWNNISSITQLVHSAVMFVLVIIQFTRQSLEMYKATKQWRLNKFMNLLVMEGVLYFLVILVWNLLTTLVNWGFISGTGWRIIPIGILEAVPMPTLIPRFVLNVRELYARSVWGGDRAWNDSEFGLSTSSCHGASKIGNLIADDEQDGGLEHGNAILVEEISA